MVKKKKKGFTSAQYESWFSVVGFVLIHILLYTHCETCSVETHQLVLWKEAFDFIALNISSL